MSTYQEIVDAARAKKTDLNVLIDGLGDKIEEITSKEFNRPLSPADKARVRELTMAQIAASNAKTELSYITLQALDTSDELGRIVNALKRARNDLNAKRSVIEKIGGLAAQLTKILGGVEAVVKQAEALLDKKKK